jgi:hypothetical protein
MHCFKKLEDCKKWYVVCFFLNKDGAGEDGLVDRRHLRRAPNWQQEDQG